MLKKQIETATLLHRSGRKLFRNGSALLALSGMLAASSPLAFAQNSSPKMPNQMNQTKEDFRRQAPPPLAPRALNIPVPFETTLSNGLRVVMLEQPRLPLVSFRLAFRTGTAYDPQEIPGLTGMVTGLLTEGTGTRTSQQIADEVARLGATLSVDATSDYTVVAASSLTNFTNQILDLMADVTLRPSFPENEIALAKQNTKQGLILQRSQAGFLANERISKVLYGDNPYSVVTPTEQSVDLVTRDKVLNFYRSTFIPNNAVLVVSGDFKRDEMLKQIEAAFGEAKWKRGTALTAKFPAPPVRESAAIYVVDRPGSAQSNIAIGNAALTRSNPDYFATLLMHTVLGANASSRLFMNLREAKGYTYGAYSNLDTRREAGTFRTTAEVRSDVTGAALKEFFYELNRIRTQPVSDKELADAKSYLSGVFPIRLETQEGMINQLVQIKMLDLPADYLQTYRDEIAKITRQDVQRVAQKYLTPDKAAIVIVGDYAKIADQIKPYASNVEVYEASGERRQMNGQASAITTQPIASNSGTTTDSANQIFGKWSLNVSSPQGNLPATLTITNDGGAAKAKIDSQLGASDLTDVKINGNTLSGNVTFDFQGQQLNAAVTARANGDKMDGGMTLTAYAGAPPLAFTGTKTK